MQSRAFAIEPWKYDIGSLDKFGKLQYLFTKEQKRSSIFSKAFTKEILDVLNKERFDPSRDFIVAYGSMIAVSRFIDAVTTKYRGVRVLFHNTIMQEYVSMELGKVENAPKGSRAIRES